MKFTQFLRPDGEQREIHIDMSDEIEKLASKLIERGCRFEIEELRTGIISMTCEDYSGARVSWDEPTIAHELCPNGPGIEDVVEKLVRTAIATPDEPEDDPFYEWPEPT